MVLLCFIVLSEFALYDMAVDFMRIKVLWVKFLIYDNLWSFVYLMFKVKYLQHLVSYNCFCAEVCMCVCVCVRPWRY